MALTALRCPECTGPVEADAKKCTYCGATLASQRPRAARTQETFSLVIRVGPSNVERVARVLRDHLRVDASVVPGAPFEVEVGAHATQAHEIAYALSEAGAQADVKTRTIEIPLLTVTLEDAGENRNAVIVAIRSHVVDLGLVETKRLLDALPHVLVEDADPEKAHALVAALAAAGAKATASAG